VRGGITTVLRRKVSYANDMKGGASILNILHTRKTKTYRHAEVSPIVLSARGWLSIRSLGLSHLCGDADNKPIQGCHDHRCAANNHEERDKDRVLERELDDEIPVIQRVVHDV